MVSEEAQHWRNKYASKLSELDKLEQTAIEKIDQLRKALLVVNLACQGLHPSLDVELTQLKKALHGENLSLDISRSLVDLQQVAEPIIEENYQQQILSALETVLDPFNSFDLDKQNNKAVKQFRKQIKQQSPSYSEIPQVIESFASLVEKLLLSISGQTNLDDDKDQTKGIWQRLFGSGEDEVEEGEDKQLLQVDSTAIATSETAESDELEQESRLQEADMAGQPQRESVDSETNQEQLNSLEQKFTAVIDHVGECILAVLSQLTVPESVVDDSQSLKNKIEKGLTWFELIPSLETLTVIVLATIGDIKEEFEHYLKNLNERLQVFQTSAEEAQTDYQQALQSADKYNQLMQKDLGELQSSVESATNLDDLKQVVSTKLDKVLESLEDQHSQLDNPPSLTDQLTQLVQRVSQMEAQTRELESTLSKEREKALQDTLTGIANRQFYEEKVRHEFARWQRYRQPLVIAVADVDFFKKINDNYGHLAGDKLLKIIAKQLDSRLREVDFIARYGGEEFAILMPNTNVVDAKTVMETVRHGIENAPFHYQGNKLQITASFGITGCREGDKSPKEVFDRADKALYEAKQTGRNRCCVA